MAGKKRDADASTGSSESEIDETIRPINLSGETLDELTKEDLKKIPRTERHLSRLRVTELRHIARQECGPGTWISHSSKDELKEGAIQGYQPRSTHKGNRGKETSSYNRSSTSSREGQTASRARALDTGQDLMSLLVDLNLRVQAGTDTSEDYDTEDAKEKLKDAVHEDLMGSFGESIINTILSVTNEVVERELGEFQSRIRRIENELGLDSGEDEEPSFSKQEFSSLFRQKTRESKEAEQEARRKINGDEDDA